MIVYFLRVLVFLSITSAVVSSMPLFQVGAGLCISGVHPGFPRYSPPPTRVLAYLSKVISLALASANFVHNERPDAILRLNNTKCSGHVRCSNCIYNNVTCLAKFASKQIRHPMNPYQALKRPYTHCYIFRMVLTAFPMAPP